MKVVSRLTGLAILLLVISLTGLGQQTSSVTGVVTDATGAVVRGAEVKLTDTKTSAVQTTKTNEQGVYSFLRVLPGQGYTLTFTAQGFDTTTMSNITLGVGVTETHNASLNVGQVTNVVQVTSSGDITLNTTDATIGNVISSKRLTELPIQIRNSPAALIGLQPGAVGNNLGAGSGARATNAVGSVTGSRSDQGNITIDGIDANDQATGQFASTVGNAPIDAIQEFRTVTANPGVGDGRSGGGQVMLVTKSGTNQFHGNIREYNRTAATAANTFFNNKTGVERPQLTRNQFGGSIGGPVSLPRFGMGGPPLINGKDKLFFFFDYEGRRDAQGVAYLRVVPLDHFRNGGLAYLNNTAGCAANSRLTTAPQCITTLTPAQVAALDPQGVGANQSLLSFIRSRYPQANDLSAGNGVNTGGFRFNSPSRRSDNTYTTRIDYNATEKQRLFGRFNIARRVNTDTVNTVAQQFPGDPETGQIVLRDYTYAIGHTWTISQSLVNQAIVGVSRSGLEFPNNFAPAFPNIFGAPGTPNGGTWGGNNFGIAAPFARISSQDRFVRVPTIRDDLTWTKGNHTMSFGGVWKPIDSKSGIVNDFNSVGIGIGGQNGALNGDLRPTSLGTGATRTQNYDAAFAFLLGRYASISTNFNYDLNGNALAPGTGKKRDFRYNEYELYAGDMWKIRNNLSLTYGVRWTYYPAPYEVNKFQAGNDVDYQTLVNARVANALAGVSGNNAEPLLSYNLIGSANDARNYYKADKNNFAPRIGFSWNPSFTSGALGKVFGDRKTVFRGGGSMTYDRVSGALTFIQDQGSFIFDNSAARQFGAASPVTALATDPRFSGVGSLPLQNVAPVITRPSIPFVDENGVPFGNADAQTNYVIAQNFKIPYSFTYSLGFQRELPGNFLLDVTYVGRQGRKLFTQADAAQALNFKDPVSGQFLFQALDQLKAQLDAGQTSANVTPIPWFQNQVRGGTTAVVSNASTLVQIGDTADTLQALYAIGRLAPNVGLSGQFSSNAYITNFGSSSYNGLLASLRKRLSKGLEFDFNYTFSHSIDNQSSVVNTVSTGLICDINNLRVCRANSDFDIRHLVNANFIYELPFGRNQLIGGGAPKWLNHIIGGWKVSGIYVYRSGLPFTTTTGAFSTSFINDSPAVLTGNTSALKQKINENGANIQFFADQEKALAALDYPAHGKVGNRNILRGVGFWNIDNNIYKTFYVLPDDKLKLTFRWEMFNTFNHNSFGLPTASIASPAFGQITSSASTPRDMQFALRLEF